jgi:hypothetical protein
VEFLDGATRLRSDSVIGNSLAIRPEPVDERGQPRAETVLRDVLRHSLAFKSAPPPGEPEAVVAGESTLVHGARPPPERVEAAP